MSIFKPLSEEEKDFWNNEFIPVLITELLHSLDEQRGYEDVKEVLA